MKKILFLIAILLCCVMTIFAQNNDRISYQAVVRDANNNLVVNRELTVLVTVNDGQNTYTETHTVTSNANGLISLLIGNGNHASNNWDNINWKTATVSTTMSDGGVQIAAHAMPLTTVPSAKYADYADSVNPDVVARQIHDTADIVRQKVGDVSEKVSNLENRLKADSANLKNNYTTTADLQNNYYNKVKMNDTIDYILTQLANTSGNLNDNYYTKAQVDTAKAHIRTEMATKDAQLQHNIDTASSQIRTDMAAMNTNLQNNIDTTSSQIRADMATMKTNLQNNIDTASSQIREAMAMMNSALQSEIALKADSSSVYTTTQIDNKFADTVRYATKAKVKADSNVVFDTLHNYYATKSSVVSQLSNYTTTAELQNTYATKTNVSEGLDSVKGHIRTEITALKTNADAIYATKAKVKADSNVVFDTLHTYYATKSAVASQLSNYTTTSDLQTNYATKNDLNAYTTTAVLEANYATKNKVQSDSNVVFDTLHNYYATKSSVVSQLSNYTTTAELQNTYATKTNVSEGLDSVKGNIRTEIGAVKSNIAENYATKTEVTTNVDSVKGNIRTEIGAVKSNITENYATKTEVTTNVDSVKGNIRTEITALKTNADAIYATKAKVKADSNVVFDTLHNYYATKSSVASQLNNYTTTSDLQTNYATKNDLNAYTTTAVLEANYATKDKVKADSNVVFDTLHNYYATKSSVASQLSNYTTTSDLQTNYATKNDLNAYTTTAVLEANYATKNKVQSDSNVVFDTLHNYYATKSSVASQLSNYTTTAALQNMLSQPLERLAELYYTKEVSDKFIATENQTTFTLSNSPTENHLVKMYINGVLVGDNVTIYYYNDPPTTFYAVIEFDPNSNDYEVTYKPASNGGYQLRAGDRVVFYYYTSEEPPYQGD